MEEQPRPRRPRSLRNLLIAIGLGPATLLITPVVGLITFALPLLLLSRMKPTSQGMESLAGLLHVRSLEDLFILGSLLVLVYFALGTGVTTMLSWFLTRSIKYALLTLACAVAAHSISIAVTFRGVQSQETRAASLADPDSVFQTYGKIQGLRVQIREPYPENWGNPNPEYGTAYQWARVFVTLEVSHPGMYAIDAHYGFRTDKVDGSTPWKSVKRRLEPGRHVIPLEFRHNEVQSYAFWDTSFVGGTAMARLSYLASDQELLDAVGGDPGFEEYLRKNSEGGIISNEPGPERSISTMELRIEPRTGSIAVAPAPPREYQYPMGSPGAVRLSVSRMDANGSTAYRYSLENRSQEPLFGFMVGAVRSSPSCPELRSAPIGYIEGAADCPGGIAIRRKWRGCVQKRADCEGYFLQLGYPDGPGLVPGETLAFTVTLAEPDSTYDRASFWIVGQRNQYEGRASLSMR